MGGGSCHANVSAEVEASESGYPKQRAGVKGSARGLGAGRYPVSAGRTFLDTAESGEASRRLQGRPA